MSNIVEPREAERLLAEGYSYVDVRSEPEFEAGHVPGAINVPLLQATPRGMQENADFLGVMRASFAPDAKLVVGCRTGARSARAARLLAEAGFSNVRDMSAGWEGARDAFGKLSPGWSRLGLATEQGSPPGRSYSDVKRRADLA